MGRLNVQAEGVTVSEKRTLNFIAGTNITLTITDDVVGNQVDIQIDSTGGGGGAPTSADYLVGTANGSLSAEIVVGTSPGGELGGTWAAPTVDVTHSGSSHAGSVTYENLSANLDIGTGATQVAQGDHAHSGTYFPIFDVTTYGAVLDGVTDDYTAFQLAIKAQQDAGGGMVYVPAGTAIIGTQLKCIPTTGSSTATCIIRGAGMFATTLKVKSTVAVASNGLFGYVSGTVNGQWDIADMTLDGNYSGVATGAIAQGSGFGALVAAQQIPFTDPSGNTAPPNGIYHILRNVRFYRPSKFTFQPSHSVDVRNCLFDQTGQPDVASGGTHWDNFGSSGYTDAIVIGNRWINSSGNYVDFIDTVGTKDVRITFIGNVSSNHQVGGVYAGGDGSVIVGNDLNNTVTAGYVGYDSGHVATKSKNICVGNRFIGLNLFSGAAPFSYASYGDYVSDNVANDTTATGKYVDQGLATAAGSLLRSTGAGAFAEYGIGANGTILTSDGTTFSWQAAGAASHPAVISHLKWGVD